MSQFTRNEPGTLGLGLLLLGLVCAGFAPAQQRPGTGQGRAPSLDDIMRRCDANGDGKVTRAEVPDNLRQRFALWDPDGDGVATREEIRKARLAMGIADSGLASNANAAPSRQLRAPLTTPTLLMGPAEWRLETLPVPPGFAPGIKLRGIEEARFAPGMFVTSSTTYFTCVLAIAAEGAPALGAAEVKDYLEQYYRGLSGGAGRRRGLTVDTGKIAAEVKPDPKDPGRFIATVPYFDTFNDGRRIVLNIEARAFTLPAAGKSFLVLMVSTQPRDHGIWQTLRQIAGQVR